MSDSLVFKTWLKLLHKRKMLEKNARIQSGWLPLNGIKCLLFSKPTLIEIGRLNITNDLVNIERNILNLKFKKRVAS